MCVCERERERERETERERERERKIEKRGKKGEEVEPAQQLAETPP